MTFLPTSYTASIYGSSAANISSVRTSTPPYPLSNYSSPAGSPVTEGSVPGPYPTGNSTFIFNFTIPSAVLSRSSFYFPLPSSTQFKSKYRRTLQTPPNSGNGPVSESDSQVNRYTYQLGGRSEYQGRLPWFW